MGTACTLSPHFILLITNMNYHQSTTNFSWSQFLIIRVFLLFFLHYSFFPYFCPCQVERNRFGQRKRILRFVPRRWTCTIHKKQEYWVESCFRCYVCILIYSHTAEQYHIHYFAFMGVQAQPSEIRISLGGSALCTVQKHAFWAIGQTNPDAPDGI